MSRNLIRQGDVLLIPVETPPGLKPHKEAIVARGEATGHHHIVIDGEVLVDADGNLYVRAGEKTELRHSTAEGVKADHDWLDVAPGLYEILGYERILESVGAKEIQRDDFGTLIQANLGDDEGKPAKFVRVKCPSTGRVYVNRVRPDARTARAAVASRWRLKPSEYELAKES